MKKLTKQMFIDGVIEPAEIKMADLATFIEATGIEGINTNPGTNKASVMNKIATWIEDNPGAFAVDPGEDADDGEIIEESTVDMGFQSLRTTAPTPIDEASTPVETPTPPAPPPVAKLAPPPVAKAKQPKKEPPKVKSALIPKHLRRPNGRNEIPNQNSIEGDADTGSNYFNRRSKIVKMARGLFAAQTDDINEEAKKTSYIARRLRSNRRVKKGAR